MPVRPLARVVGPRLLRVEVAGQQLDKGVERLVGTLTLCREDDLFAVLGAEAMTPRMLVASTASSPGRPISMSRPLSPAACTKSEAGRACSPTDEAMVTVRWAMSRFLSMG